MFKFIKNHLLSVHSYYVELTADDSGRPSLSKSILFWAAVTAGCVIWKLTLEGKLTLDYFGAFLAWSSGHSLTSKFLDAKKPAKPETEKE